MDHFIATRTLEIRKDDWTRLRLVEAEVDAGLGADEAWLRIDRFALTANNISYCLAGDMLGYWGFFPAEEGWGRVPVMGYADVIASAHPGVAVGERVWGFFPMGTHLRIRAGKVQPHAFADLSAHRQPYSPLYAQYLRSAANPWYEPAREDQDLLLRGMHLTGWLLEDYLHDNAGFGAQAVVVSSASSKTAIAFAHRAHERGERALLGLTSARNRDFVVSLGCYDRVLGYDEVGLLDATQPAALVDFAGDAALTARVHHHFGERLRHSASVGATHHDRGGATSGLPGATPEFFFAPGQMQKRGAEWGPGEVERRVMEHFARFRVWCDAWLRIERGHGPEAAIAAFERLRTGQSAPWTGHVLSLWPAR